MKIVRHTETKEVTVALKNVEPGDCIRFQHDTLEDAFKSDLFWMRLDVPELKDDRVRLANYADGKRIERDGDHRCIIHECALQIQD